MAPSCPHPRPQGPGGLHSPVFHDTAHVVDGAVAQVGAQEVAHQLGRNTCHQMGRHEPQALNGHTLQPSMPSCSPPPPTRHRYPSLPSKCHQTLASARPLGKCAGFPQHATVWAPRESEAIHCMPEGPCSVLRLTHHLPWEVPVGWQGRPYLPARFTELLDVDGAAEGDDEQGEALGWQTVVANHSIQHLQRHLGGGERVRPACLLPAGMAHLHQFPPMTLWSGMTALPLPKWPSWDPQSQCASGKPCSILVTAGHLVINNDPRTDVTQPSFLRES